MNLNLASTPEEFRELALAAIEIVTQYYRELPNMPIMPVTTARELRGMFSEPLPQDAGTCSEVLRTIQDVVFPLCRHNGHSRFFGYITSPGSAAAAIGDLLTAALNANVTSWRSSPAATELEHVVIDWLKAIIGYDPISAGLLVSGGSMANLSALAAARTSAELRLAQTASAPKTALRIYISEEGHFSIKKAAHLLGIGATNIQWIPTDTSLRVNVSEMERRINADRQCGGITPMCIVANAGTTSTGAVDPIEDLAQLAERYGLWLHVDAAYGGFSALAPSAKHMFSGIHRADSVSLDPHKWLYTSVGCGAFCIGIRMSRPRLSQKKLITPVL